jgi:hypothetical protein
MSCPLKYRNKDQQRNALFPITSSQTKTSGQKPIVDEIAQGRRRGHEKQTRKLYHSRTMNGKQLEGHSMIKMGRKGEE